jgi:hypothetical protein
VAQFFHDLLRDRRERLQVAIAQGSSERNISAVVSRDELGFLVAHILRP